MKYVWGQEEKPGIPAPSHLYNPLSPNSSRLGHCNQLHSILIEFSPDSRVVITPYTPPVLWPCVVRKVFGVMQVKVQILVLPLSNHFISVIPYFQHKISTVIINEITYVNHLVYSSKGPFIIFNLFKNSLKFLRRLGP